jgi:hypothetical protein
LTEDCEACDKTGDKTDTVGEKKKGRRSFKSKLAAAAAALVAAGNVEAYPTTLEPRTVGSGGYLRFNLDTLTDFTTTTLPTMTLTSLPSTAHAPTPHALTSSYVLSSQSWVQSLPVRLEEGNEVAQNVDLASLVTSPSSLSPSSSVPASVSVMSKRMDDQAEELYLEEGEKRKRGWEV